jgi:lysozyme family protein
MTAEITPRLQGFIDGILEREGGFVDHPSDKGGPTNWGVKEAVARASGWHGDMRNLPRAFAEEIYLEQFIYGPGFSTLLPLSVPIAEELVDTGVNCGPGRAAHFFQRVLNGLNRRGRLYQDIRVDGRCGPMTRASLASYLQARGRQQGELVMLRLLDSLQGTHYLEFAERDERQEDFLFGWALHRLGGKYS